MKLFRKRMIPEEIVELNKDELLFKDDNVIVTKWNSIRPKIDLHHGTSCYFLKEGYKVSKFYKEDGTLMYWYCDIVCYDYEKETDSYIFTDLLADVIVYPDGFVKVVDMDEVAKMVEQKELDSDKLCKLLYQLNNLLEIIYAGDFCKLQNQVEKWEKNWQIKVQHPL